MTVIYTCKYAPVELFAGFGETCAPFDDAPEDFAAADEFVHPNLCGFGKDVVQKALSGAIDQLVLVNCCDTNRRVFDIVKASGKCRFVYLLDLPHCADACAIDRFAFELGKLARAYAAFSGKAFDATAFRAAFAPQPPVDYDYVGLVGVRANHYTEQVVQAALSLPVRNLTCTGLRSVAPLDDAEDEDALFSAYAASLLGQIPCARMERTGGRRQILADPHLTGIVYHTLRFCDYYAPEGARWHAAAQVPFLQIESDYTKSGSEQLRTRVEAFAEELEGAQKKGPAMTITEDTLVAGIDSGSTSTDVVIMNGKREIVASAIIPTRGSASASAERSLQEALDQAGIPRKSIAAVVATGYGRDAIGSTDSSVTEITCHAKGAHYLNPQVRTIVDIGGQDSKAIAVDEHGNVTSFAMNDKCAAGTGRFLEMMARTLGVELAEMSTLGAKSGHAVSISSTCSVFAESEVVSLVANDTPLPDIVAGLNRSVARRTAALAKRVGVNDTCMMTGGVAKNEGVVRAIEEAMGHALVVDDRAQLAGAIGAALFALAAWSPPKPGDRENAWSRRSTYGPDLSNREKTALVPSREQDRSLRRSSACRAAAGGCVEKRACALYPLSTGPTRGNPGRTCTVSHAPARAAAGGPHGPSAFSTGPAGVAGSPPSPPRGRRLQTARSKAWRTAPFRRTRPCVFDPGGAFRRGVLLLQRRRGRRMGSIFNHYMLWL